MVKKLFVGLRMSKDTHVVDLAELRPAFIPKGHIVADIEIAREDGVSAGYRNSVLCSRDMVDAERIPHLGLNRHGVRWNRQTGIVDIDSVSGGIHLMLRVIYKPKEKVEWYE